MMTPEKMIYENNINDLEQQLKYFTNKSKRLEQDNKKLNNIINELEKDLIKYFKKEYPDRKLENCNLEYCTYDYALVLLGKLQELKEGK